MTRVTYPQFPFLSFNSSESFSPVRNIGENLVKDKKTSPFNCGSVVVLKGKSDGKYIELDNVLWNGPQAAAPAPAPVQAAVAEAEPETTQAAPATFQYPFGDGRDGSGGPPAGSSS
jgi:hypothetical protein